MKPTPVIAIFDVGKTNKKLLLFDEDHNIVFERSARFAEINDEDGFPCENLDNLKRSVEEALTEISATGQFELKAVNFSAYGASLVYLDENGEPAAPLYNYLKPYPEKLLNKFYRSNGGKQAFCRQTASPALGSLNSGLQLYRLKHENPSLFKKIRYALHLPQYLSWLLTREVCSDLTSIGCHTALWDFTANDYHQWVYKEGLDKLLAPVQPSDKVFQTGKYITGVGLHDSSAALIPYLKSFDEPFVLISTGTWSISLNPFNLSPLTAGELRNDCLNYMQFTGAPVKASRFFIGNIYEEGLRQLEARFGEDLANYRNLEYEPALAKIALKGGAGKLSVAEAYYNLIARLVKLQKKSTDHILQDRKIRQIFVDGGFSRNHIFMKMLATEYSQYPVYAATIPQSTALGAALAIHQHWSRTPLPATLVKLEQQ